MIRHNRRLCTYGGIAVSRTLECASSNSALCSVDSRAFRSLLRRSVQHSCHRFRPRHPLLPVARAALNRHGGAQASWMAVSSHRWMNTSGVTQDATHPHSLEWPYLERTIDIHTCADLYSKWRREGRDGYLRAPAQGGLRVAVSYVHTGMDRAEKSGREDSGRRPLVVILTGAPGSYRDFAYLIPFLDRNGVDVVSPVWPDLAFSRDSGCWWHSSQEKTNLALDFLAAINVAEADMLVAHSSGSFPALRMVTKPGGLRVKALTLLTPAGHRPITKMQPHWFTVLLGYLYKRRWAQKLCEGAGYTYLTLSKHPLKKNMDNAILAMYAMLYADYAQLAQDAETLKRRRLPMLVAVSDNDKLIDPPISLDFVRLLGGHPEKSWYYDQDRRLVREGEDNHLRMLQFSRGSHYVFSRCADVVNPEILRLLSQVMAHDVASSAEAADALASSQVNGEVPRVRLRLGEKQ